MKIVDPSKIQHIEFIGCAINATGFSHILYRLARAQNSTIRSITLTGNPIGDSGIASMIEILPAVHLQIESVKIGNINRVGSAFYAEYQVFRSNRCINEVCSCYHQLAL